jgi:conjugal transfer pilus assembly protein TraA
MHMFSFDPQSVRPHLLMLAVLALAMTPMAVQAGAGGGEFDTIYTTLTDWSQGTLGRVIALGMVLVGLGIGVIRQSIMGAIVGIAGGLALFNAPEIIDGIVGAVI